MNFLKNLLLCSIVLGCSAIVAADLATKQGAQEELNRIMTTIDPLAAIDPTLVQDARARVTALNDLLSQPNLVIPPDLQATVDQVKADIVNWNKYLANVPDVVAWKAQFLVVRNAIQPIITALVDAPVPTTLTAASLTAAREAANAAIVRVKTPVDQANAAILSAQQAFTALASGPALANKGIALPWSPK